ncbi:MAG: hypothetical protein H7335_20185 [Massilia sp.]|nr:hypothetical protein [Massilia sp.]
MDIEQDHGDAGASSTPDPAGTAIAPKNPARRKFTMAGITASGVLLTLVSQPGMASTNCTALSSVGSNTMQSVQKMTQLCAGKAPEFYRGGNTLSTNPQGITAAGANAPSTGIQSVSIRSPVGWPSQVSPSTLFRTVFPCVGSTAGTFGTSTLGAMLSHESFDTSKLGMYMVATYLNIMSNRTPFPTAPQLQAIWYDWQTYGYYSPTAGVKWYAADIVLYLSGNMT